MSDPVTSQVPQSTCFMTDGGPDSLAHFFLDVMVSQELDRVQRVVVFDFVI